MNIEALRLVVTEEEANTLLIENFPKDAGVEDLRIAFAPNGIQVRGKYPTMLLHISFETSWTVTVSEGLLAARLSDIRVSGLPAGKLRGVLLGMLADTLTQNPGVTVQGDVVQVDLNAALKAKEVPVSIRLTGVHCTTGKLVVEAG
jgi:hypothetical protein